MEVGTFAQHLRQRQERIAERADQGASKDEDRIAAGQLRGGSLPGQEFSRRAAIAASRVKGNRPRAASKARLFPPGWSSASNTRLATGASYPNLSLPAPTADRSGQSDPRRLGVQDSLAHRTCHPQRGTEGELASLTCL